MLKALYIWYTTLYYTILCLSIILLIVRQSFQRRIYRVHLAIQGEFWVTLHRSMAEYVHKSPDNQARSLLAYFSGMMVRYRLGEGRPGMGEVYSHPTWWGALCYKNLL